MVRKQTWVVLVIFIVLLGAAFYLRKNPLPAASTPTLAPSAAPVVQMLEGWQAQDIVSINYQGSSGQSVLIAQAAQGSWVSGPDGKTPVDAGKVEELRTQLAGAQAQTTLDPGYALDPIGLSAPAHTFTLKNQQGQQSEVRIGKETPTGSGYYVQVDNRAPVVVSSGAVDAMIGAIKSNFLAPEAPGTLEPTPTS